MGGHGWTWVVADGYGLGMGTNSKENVGLCFEDGFYIYISISNPK
jgi:hypothetical protein